MLTLAAEIFEDISLSNVRRNTVTVPMPFWYLLQWLALTPPELVKAHLGFDDATIAHLPKTKQTVIGPAWMRWNEIQFLAKVKLSPLLFFDCRFKLLPNPKFYNSSRLDELFLTTSTRRCRLIQAM